jgi:hypothetical protein
MLKVQLGAHPVYKYERASSKRRILSIQILSLAQQHSDKLKRITNCAPSKFIFVKKLLESFGFPSDTPMLDKSTRPANVEEAFSLEVYTSSQYFGVFVRVINRKTGLVALYTGCIEACETDD